MTCEHIFEALKAFHVCEETQDGARVLTTCLYPSFQPVEIYVVKFGDGFIVHDGGEARGMSWVHGRDHRLADRQITEQANRFGLQYEGGRLICKVETVDWLQSAILAVSNAAAVGAYNALEKIVRASEETLRDRMFSTLRRFVPEKRLAKEYEYVGASGKKHSFDLAVTTDGDFLTLLDAVVPHHNSISSKYVAFADTKERPDTERMAVHDNHIPPEDKSLLLQVADVLPFAALQAQAPHIAARLR